MFVPVPILVQVPANGCVWAGRPFSDGAGFCVAEKVMQTWNQGKWATPQLNTLRDEDNRTSRTVRAERSSETKPLIHARAASSVIPFAPTSANCCCILRNTARHRSTVPSASFLALTDASNKSQQPIPSDFPAGPLM